MAAAFSTITRLVIALWCAYLVNAGLLGGALNELGIRPRQISGLVGILFCPILHGSVQHLANNTLGLLTVGLLAYRNEKQFWFLTGMVVLVGGLGTWVLGERNTIIIGASGVIYGYLGYLLSIGIFERSLHAITLSLLTFLVFSGMVYGILPSDTHVSWQGHLAGLIAGITVAQKKDF